MVSTRKDFRMEDILAQIYADSDFECDETHSEDSMASGEEDIDDFRCKEQNEACNRDSVLNYDRDFEQVKKIALFTLGICKITLHYLVIYKLKTC